MNRLIRGLHADICNPLWNLLHRYLSKNKIKLSKEAINFTEFQKPILFNSM